MAKDKIIQLEQEEKNIEYQIAEENKSVSKTPSVVCLHDTILGTRIPRHFKKGEVVNLTDPYYQSALRSKCFERTV